MSIVKSLSVGHGDMFYIRHDSDNFTIIDCYLSEDNQEDIVQELKTESKEKGVTRFISTHPDEDHIQGIAYLDKEMPIVNFYCIKNEATKEDESDSFKHYCSLRDSDKAYYVKKGCTRRWMNQANEERGPSGINILWPDASNANFNDELQNAKNGTKFNNISLVASYTAANEARMLWLGDLETSFMKSIEDHISLSHVHVVFAPHHGRDSGKIPDSWLDKLKPKIIVIGEAPSRHLNYYAGYDTLTQNMAGDITFDCDDAGKIHIYASNEEYEVDYLDYEGRSKYNYYLGTLNF
ncbi:Metal-dependent hydrolase, beta-lactamase superfamily II [Rhizobiales bacterium GAS113]|nr:Metal-dependent hydrolase, beta-lactamase superfamily II [Rhizobiales bacterium GAS113]